MPTQYTGLNRDPKFPNFRSSWVTLSKVSRTHAETQRRKMWVRTLCRHELDRTRQDNPEIKSIWQDGCFPPSTVTVHSGRRKNRQRCLALLERPLLQRPREPGIGLLIVFIPTIFKAPLLLKICSNCHELTLRVLQKKKNGLSSFEVSSPQCLTFSFVTSLTCLCGHIISSQPLAHFLSVRRERGDQEPRQRPLKWQHYCQRHHC